MEDINENVADKKIINFINENGMVNVHEQVSNIYENELDSTYKYRTKYIDIIMSTYGLIDYIARCQIIECDKDYRGYLLDIEIERYCQYKLNKYDQPNHTILNNMRKSHISKFNKKVT